MQAWFQLSEGLKCLLLVLTLTLSLGRYGSRRCLLLGLRLLCLPKAWPLSCAFTLQIPMTAALIHGKHDHPLSHYVLTVRCTGLTWGSCLK